MIKHIRWTTILVTALMVMALSVDCLAAAYAPRPVAPTTGSRPNMPQAGTTLQTDYPKRASALNGYVEHLQTTLQLTERRLIIVRRALEEKQVQVNAGVAPQSELGPLEEERAELEASLAQVLSNLRDAERLAKLAAPVDVELNEASLRQVAAALTKATGLQISVDSRIKDDPAKTFTLKVQGAPLGQIVEQIADSAGVLIAPAKDGIAFVPQARGSINGTDVAAPSPTSPWSTEWVMGGYARPAGQKWLGLIEAVNTAWTSADLGLLRRPGQTTAPAAPAWAEGGTPQPVITSMSPNTFIVGEPGTNDKGEPGMWLTFYSIDSGKMIVGIKYFHRFTAPAAQTAPAAAPECDSNNDL